MARPCQQLTGAAESNVAQAFKANLMHCTWIGSQNIEFWIEVFHLLFSENRLHLEDGEDLCGEPHRRVHQ